MSAPSGRRIEAPLSIAQLAASAVRKMILSGELRPGDRVVENQVAGVLGVSKPPLREALRVLEQEGLVVRSPRRGVVVTPLTLHDVYEIVTLRHDLEHLAVDLGVPCRAHERIDRCWAAYAELERAAEAGDAAAVTERGFAFHIAVVGLARHQRLEDAYRAMALQLHLCMAMNRRARRSHETLAGTPGATAGSSTSSRRATRPPSTTSWPTTATAASCWRRTRSSPAARPSRWPGSSSCIGAEAYENRPGE
jgi:DNA-binding GntR family transcriptional regulator